MDLLQRVDELREINDAVERWNQVVAFQGQTSEASFHLAALKTEIVLQLRGSGMSLQQAADRLGISKSRAAQISAQRTP